MFISRFNRFFDRHSRIIYISLGLVISLSFVVFVTPRGMSRGSGGVPKGSIGTMYGKKLSQKEFMHQLHLADLSYYLRSGEFMSQDSARETALMQETLRRIRAMHEAKKRGIDAVSTSELEDLLRKVFARDGKFDRELFGRFEDNVLYRNNLDGADLDEALRQNIVMARLDADVQASIYVSPNEARDLFDQFGETFAVSYAVLKADVAKDGDPGADEVNAYFEAHREELRTSPQRRVRVVQFTPEEHLTAVVVDDKEITEYYERLKATAYKGKELDEVKPQITTMLQRQKARTLAGAAAREFVKAFTENAPEGETPTALAERFSAAATAAQLTLKDTGAFGLEGAVPNIGKFPAFQRQAYALTESGPVSDVIYDAGRYFIACWLETIAGEVPEALDDDVRKQVADLILAGDARVLYAEKVEAYRQPLEECEAAWDLSAWYDQQLEGEAGLSTEEKESRREAFRGIIRDYISPYFVRRQKKARVASFQPMTFEAQVVVSDEQIKAYYDENTDMYNKEEVRARQILVNLPPSASADEVAAKRAVLEKALAEIKGGKLFDDVATEVSEDLATKVKGGDMGFFARGGRSEAIDQAAFSMDVGEISGILETGTALVVLKVEEKRAGKALADVRTEIQRKLIADGADQKAMDAAETFAALAFSHVEDARGSGALPADVFAAAAAKQEVTVSDTEFFTDGGVMQPLGYEPELARAAFKLTAEDPLSDAVKGKKSVFVACWLATKDPELPVLEGNDQLLQRVVSRVKRDRAIRAARSKALAIHGDLVQALADGKEFGEASKGIEGAEFKQTEPFPRNQPPTELPEARAMIDQLAEAAPGTLLEPIDNSNGATLVYLVSRELPSDAEFEADRERFENQAQWSKRYAIVQGFYDDLEKSSQTVLLEPWATQMAKKPTR